MDSERIRFYLKRPKEDGPTAIIMKIQINRESFKYYTGKSIHPELWNIKKGRVTDDSTLISHWRKHDPQIKTKLENINTRLDLILRSTVSFVIHKEQAEEQFTSEELKAHLDSRTNKRKAEPKTIGVLDYIENYVSEVISGKRLTTNHTKFSEGTIKNYKGFLVQFELYQKTKNRHIRFNDIDNGFYLDFMSFFNTKGYSPNTVGRHIKSLKVVLRVAEQEGVHSNNKFQDFYVLNVPTDSVYLNEEEVKAIKELDLSNSPKYDLARDVFLIGCHTALRYSDYSRLSKEHIVEEDNLIKIINKKTDKTTYAPYHQVVREILVKYDFNLPKTYEQKVNKYIKEIGRLAGIDNIIEVVEIRGGEKKTVLYPKHELIMTHTARRSAATNWFLAGISPIIIMMSTGHATEKDFMKYIRVKNKQAATILSQHPYFN